MSAVVYLDSSAIVKLAVRERESDALRHHVGAHAAVSSALAKTEVTRAVLDLGADALASSQRVLRTIALVSVSDEILEAAGTLRPAGLRSLDAIHLATAELLGADVRELVTYDRRMIDAAASLGLAVMSPGAAWVDGKE